MPAFDAGEGLEALDWDFTGAGVQASGCIPEPSDKKIGAFLDGTAKLYEAAQKAGLTGVDTENATPEQMVAALGSLTGQAFEKFMADTAGLFAALCSNQPSKVQLLELPLRVRARFYEWVQREVVSPEAGPGGGNAVVRALPSAAAG